MTGASKILTVSYGTFSCTLEGFDDPFNTMKAIAEYFRDLAAEDRYFGAEPPTPDAAMLHRIAEREIQRRVEAKIQDNGVILRAGDSAAPEHALAEPPLSLQVPTLAPAESDGEGVAARLQRIRARHAAQTAAAMVVADEAEVAPEAAPVLDLAPVAETDTYIEDQHAEDLIAAPEAAAPSIEIPDQLVTILDEAENDAALAEEAFAEASRSAPADLAPVEALSNQPELSVQAEGFADLSEDFADLPEAEDFDPAQPELPEAATQADDDALLASLAQDLPLNAAEAPVEVADDLPDDDSDTGMLDEAEVDAGLDDADILSRLSDMAAEDHAAGAEPAATEDLTAAEIAAETDPMGSEAEGLIEAGDQVAEAEVAAPPADDLAEEAPKPQRARARVIRIRRADPVAPVAVPPAPEPAVSALSDEAEAALQAELAALEAEVGGFAAPQEPQETLSTPPEALADPEPEDALDEGTLDATRESLKDAEPVAEPRRAIDIPAEDDAVSRLMAQANSEMGGEETRRRQSAIAHLKAAVAATAADRSPIRGDEAQRQEAYRSDLDRVVRPRRPVAETSTARPAQPVAETAQRPTPLVLVSAQRIDRAPEAPAQAPAAATPRVVMPVRPRRVTAADLQAPPAPAARAVETATPEPRPVIDSVDQSDFDDEDILAPGETDNVFADATSFQDFADQLGATTLPDLLEAAAVYCAEVLQRPEFSRPLVMRQLAGLPGQSAAAREDYLRGFGTLLRQGRIAKVKRGMFALTDRSPYLAEARKQAS